MPEPTMSNRPNQSYLGKVFLIAWREFRYTALTKGFIFGAVAMPVLMFGVIAVIPAMLSQKSPPLVGTIVVVDPSDTIVPRAKAILETPINKLQLAGEFAKNPPMDRGAQFDAMSDLTGDDQQVISVEWRSEKSLDAVESV